MRGPAYFVQQRCAVQKDQHGGYDWSGQEKVSERIAPRGLTIHEAGLAWSIACIVESAAEADDLAVVGMVVLGTGQLYGFGIGALEFARSACKGGTRIPACRNASFHILQGRELTRTRIMEMTDGQ